jgi:hypothetical protein
VQPTTLRYYSRLVGGQFARFVCGNDAGLSNNVSGRIELRRLRRSVRVQAWAASTRGAAEQLNRAGFVGLDTDADSATLGRIRARYDELITDPDASIDLGMGSRPDAVRHVIDPVARIPEIASLFTDRVADVIRAAFGTECAISSVRLWRTIHIPDHDLTRRGRVRSSCPVSVMANTFHNDEHSLASLKYLVQLTPDVTADTGAFRIIPVDATKRIVRTGFLRPDLVVGPARRRLEAAEDVVVFDGPPGSGLLCNTERCLHRAGIPKAGSERAMIQFAVVPSATPLDADWPDKMRADRDVYRD